MSLRIVGKEHSKFVVKSMVIPLSKEKLIVFCKLCREIIWIEPNMFISVFVGNFQTIRL